MLIVLSMNTCQPSVSSVSHRTTSQTLANVVRWGVVCLFSSLIVPIHAQPSDGFEDRKQIIIDALVASSEIIESDNENDYKNAADWANACFAKGEDEKGRYILNYLIDLTNEDGDRGLTTQLFLDPEFSLVATMACYLRWKDNPDKITPDLRQKIKAYVTNAYGKEDGRGTYNHLWMRSAGLMLAHQEWPDEMQWVFERDSSEVIDRDGRRYFENELNEMVHTGHQEYGSSTYFRHTTAPLQIIRDFYADAEVRRKAQLALEWTLIDLASHHFYGHAGTTTARTYFGYQPMDNYLAPSYLYFGGPVNTNHTQIVHALSDYRPPQIILDIAQAKDVPFVRQATTFEDGQSKKERHVSYFNRDYVLFCHYDVEPQVYQFRSQMFRGGVRWKAPADTYSTFYITHPKPRYTEDGGLRDEYLGASERHQVLQHEQTQIGVFDINEDSTDEYQLSKIWRLRTPVGEAVKALINESAEGQLFIHYGSVMIAFHITHGFEWNGEEDDFRYALPFEEGHYRAGYVIETALPADYAGSTPDEQLANFRQAAHQAFSQAALAVANENPEFSYTAVDSTALKLVYREPGSSANPSDEASSQRWINGQEVDINDDALWPLIQTPYVTQDYNGDVLTLNYQGDQRVYDFSDFRNSVTYYRIKNRLTGQYLYDQHNQARYGTPAPEDPAAYWQLEVEEGYYRMKNRATGDYLHIQGLRDYVEATVINPGWSSAQWQLLPGEDNYVQVRNRWASYPNRLHVENQVGYVEHSDTIPPDRLSAQWLLEQVPATPDSLTATQTDSTVSLRWKSQEPEEEQYIIERRIVSEYFTPIDTVENGAQSYVDSSLSVSDVYYYRVAALKAEVRSQYATAVAVDYLASPIDSSSTYLAGRYYLRHVATGNYLDSDPGGVIKTTPRHNDTSQHWQLLPVTGDIYTINRLPADRGVLDAKADGIVSWGNTDTASWPDDHQWRAVVVAGKEATYRFESVMDGRGYLAVKNQKVVWNDGQPGVDTEWRLEPAETAPVAKNTARSSQAGFVVYPNPTSGLVVVDKLDDTIQQVAVYNAMGFRIGQADVHQGRATLDLAVSPGMYVIRAGQNQAKLIVQ